MSNFPPVATPLPTIWRALLNQNASIPTTALFTANTPGWYLVQGLVHIVSTDNAGTLTFTIGQPHSPTFSPTVNIGTGKDSNTGLSPAWLEAGDSVTVTTVATGLTGTVYNVLMAIVPVLNPPPEITTTAALTNQTGTTGTQALLTIPETGCYLLTGLCHLLTTDKAGTLAGTINVPNFTTVNMNPDIANGLDSRTGSRAFYMQAGGVISVSMTATGLTGTIYNSLVNIIKLF